MLEMNFKYKNLEEERVQGSRKSVQKITTLS